jgi:hypothetical protein
MTDVQRAALNAGDRVIVRLDGGEEREFEVKYPPWVLGDGTAVVGLVGIAGGYRLSRVMEKCE